MSDDLHATKAEPVEVPGATEPATPQDPGERMLKAITVFLNEGVITKRQVLDALKIKGRSGPEYPDFTFPGSGITVKIRRLGPFTIDAIGVATRKRKKDTGPRPNPPMRQVNYAADDEPPRYEWEANLADPEYKRALAEWEMEAGREEAMSIIDTIIRNAVIVDLGEAELAEVGAARAFLRDIGVDEEELDKLTDHEIYVKHICIKATSDLNALQEYVIGESVPTEELIQEHEDSFKSDVQKTTHTPVPNAKVGGPAQNGVGLGTGNPVVGPIH